MTTQQGRESRGGGGRPATRRFSGRRRRQCVCKEVGTIDYKDVSILRRFITDRGRIESGRKSGNCAKCQRELSTAISRARFLALLPFAPNHLRVTGSIAPATAASSDEDEEAEDAEDESPNEENETSEDESEETSDSVESSEDESDESDDSEDSDDESDEDEDEEEKS